MLDSGNFVLYDEHSYVIWQSFDHPTDTILGGQNLTEDDYLVSTSEVMRMLTGIQTLRMVANNSVLAFKGLFV
ncbi:G-type lectin S-receptor-like serine/threonine protein kinase RLK1-like [Trifolium medium]|uniref:G-type lectin S-receptor-like serine/threonine protein kinase RLK1-like n=1 Tax=Trifolium medium TaxID=97028 RepID=A0A392RAK8_9FABA|nr:G-type lectin S-receptor-like serine/threonine protein kinase RLK1-like [Trifolium medium]